MSGIVPKDNNVQESVTTYSAGLQKYLEDLGLPTDKVLVVDGERFRVVQNFPDAVTALNPEGRARAYYLSKFVAACGAGLFDAALNFLWNEVVTNLRAKVARFDLEYFYTSVITDARRRSKFTTADHLVDVEDWELIKGCRDTGILSDIAYRHLDYIRDMRNHASAAHPNHTDLSGFQLISWLETCIKEVLAREPEGPVLEVKRFLHNVRTETLTAAHVKPIFEGLSGLTADLLDMLLRTCFGMYTDPAIDTRVRSNLKLMVAGIWDRAPKQAKLDTGVKYASFAVNGEVTRQNLGHEFLTLCNGLGYIPEGQRAAEMDWAIDELFRAHSGWDNFHNEPAPARVLRAYVPPNGDVPQAVRHRYVKTLTMCWIGNGYGVSRAAMDHYNDMIGKFQDDLSWYFFALIYDPDVRSRLQFSSCLTRFKQLAAKLADTTANPNLKRGLTLAAQGNPAALHNAPEAEQIYRMYFE